ncbi:GNAT family N-acetyltransferase [Flavobacterium frigidarium]|uniref:GNAT family N-acetyltransferase n=1 Tax=Flavobacterium frigidarium TaxID=99286 RepID=A0ABV4KAN6_9FLAO
MIIRKATSIDAPDIAECLLLAMESIVYTFIGKNDSNVAYEFLLHFVAQEDNQYSYQNCWVVSNENQIIGAINIYNGANLHTLRMPIINYLKTNFNREIIIDDETQAGEYYIDTLGIKTNQQGKGIGFMLLQFIIDKFVHKQNQTLGLLVEKENRAAQRLYKKLGFIYQSDKNLVGKQLEHMQIKRQKNNTNN